MDIRDIAIVLSQIRSGVKSSRSCVDLTNDVTYVDMPSIENLNVYLWFKNILVHISPLHATDGSHYEDLSILFIKFFNPRQKTDLMRHAFKIAHPKVVIPHSHMSMIDYLTQTIIFYIERNVDLYIGDFDMQPPNLREDAGDLKFIEN